MGETSSNDDIRMAITDMKDEVLGRLTLLEDKVDKIDKHTCTIETLSNDVETLQQTVTYLNAKLIRNEKTMMRLVDEVTEVKAHSMKCNIKFNFDRSTNVGKEIEGEDAISIVRRFLGDVMHVPGVDNFFIPVAHRLGPRINGVTRPILAKFPVSEELNLLFRHTNRLRETRHSVVRQMPPAMNERKQFAFDEYKAKKVDPRNKARLSNDKLFLKGKLQTQFQRPVLPDSSDLEAPLIMEGTEIREKGSTFNGYAANIASMEELKSCIDAVIVKPGVASSSHMIYAYRITDGRRKVVENFSSDGDHGMGLSLLKHLRNRTTTNTVCIVTRNCDPGFVHLGNRRFELMCQTVDVALNELGQ